MRVATTSPTRRGRSDPTAAATGSCSGRAPPSPVAGPCSRGAALSLFNGRHTSGSSVATIRDRSSATPRRSAMRRQRAPRGVELPCPLTSGPGGGGRSRLLIGTHGMWRSRSLEGRHEAAVAGALAAVRVGGPGHRRTISIRSCGAATEVVRCDRVPGPFLDRGGAAGSSRELRVLSEAPHGAHGHGVAVGGLVPSRADGARPVRHNRPQFSTGTVTGIDTPARSEVVRSTFALPSPCSPAGIGSTVRVGTADWVWAAEVWSLLRRSTR